MPDLLPADEIHLWLARLPAQLTPQLLALTTPDEQARAQTMASVRRQREWLTGRALLRQCLAFYTRHDALALTFAKTEAGKPTLSLPGAPAFNLSHGPGWIGCAVAHTPCIGLDIDCAARRNRVDDIAARYFHPAEQQALAHAADDTERKHRFFTRWTLKEAYIKARGATLNSVRLHDIAFAEEGNTVVPLFALPTNEQWQFQHWPFDGDHHLALACQQPSCETVARNTLRARFWLWDPEQNTRCESALFSTAHFVSPWQNT